MTFGSRVSGYHQRLTAALDHWLPPAALMPSRLHEAMRYSSEGGKRLRPLLVYAAAEVLDLPPRSVDPAAVAVELIHVYSLVHDDLPAMDNDDLRRGRPTCHRRFDEATAILAGDALQTLAFAVLAQDAGCDLEPAQRLRMVSLLAEAAGSRGMAGGQMLDLQAVGGQLSLAELEALHIHKTGALIRACVLMACQARGLLASAERDALDRYAKCLGLAFQIQDDVLDVESSTAELGKTGGKDRAANKPTYPSVMGMPAAKTRAAELFADARSALGIFDERAEPLLWLLDHIETRKF